MTTTSNLPTTNTRSGYWNSYYSQHATDRRPLPSQFAAFVAGELTEPYRVIEFGCGGGRDALFFSAYGHSVTGVDGSEAAVDACRALAAKLGEPVTFLTAQVDDDDLFGRLADSSAGPHLVYARFFVHAITDEEEASFIDLAARITSPGDLLAVEYRTIRDSSGPKVTGSHYRRFVTPSTFQARALARGFEVTYTVEGFGFAKYKLDDAYVARTVFTRR